MLHAQVNINGKDILNEDELKTALVSKDDLTYITCNKDEKALEIEFSKKRDAFIGWVNADTDEIYYFDNGSGNKEPVELLINVCPEERMMCYDFESVKAIIRYFLETGERSPAYSWIEDASC